MLEVVNVRKSFPGGKGERVDALDGVSLTVREGTLFTLLGASGSGKTTMLRSIAGLERPEAGEIRIGGVTVLDGGTGVFVPPSRRQLGMVFQSYAIWPHMTVFDNVAYPLRVRGAGRAELRRSVATALETVQMDHLADRPATALSGGQQQRLALARATIGNPRLLLLDEPLSNLDAKLREQMRFELKRLQRDLGITTVYVTHDQAEALALSDDIAVMHNGRIAQTGTPREIYAAPATPYVADFIGSANLLPAQVVSCEEPGGEAVVTVGEATCRGSVRTACRPGGQATLTVRPEEIELVRDGELPGDRNTLAGVVHSSVFLGESLDFLIDCGSLRVRVRARDTLSDVPPGQRVALAFSPRSCLVFGSDEPTDSGLPSPEHAAAA